LLFADAQLLSEKSAAAGAADFPVSPGLCASFYPIKALIEELACAMHV